MRRVGIIGLAAALIIGMGALPAGAGWDPITSVRRTPNQVLSLDMVAVGDTVHVVWVEYTYETIATEQADGEQADAVIPHPTIRYRRSTDGGATWGPHVILATLHNRWTDVALAADGDIVHAVWRSAAPVTGFQFAPGPVFHRRSTNAGATWRPVRRIASGAVAPPAVAAANGKVHVLYGTPQAVWYLRSSSAGAFWGAQPRRVSKLGESIGLVGPQPLLTLAGSTVIILYQPDSLGGPQPVRYRRSIDQGTTWQPLRKLTKALWSVSWFEVAADGNHVHVTLNGKHRTSWNSGGNWTPWWPGIWPNELGVRASVVDAARWVSGGANNRIQYLRSADFGSSWGTRTIRHTTWSPGQMKMSSGPGGVALAWVEFNPADDRFAIWFRHN